LRSIVIVIVIVILCLVVTTLQRRAQSVGTMPSSEIDRFPIRESGGKATMDPKV
jgi:hypothetical protein